MYTCDLESAAMSGLQFVSWRMTNLMRYAELFSSFFISSRSWRKRLSTLGLYRSSKFFQLSSKAYVLASRSCNSLFCSSYFFLNLLFFFLISSFAPSLSRKLFLMVCSYIKISSDLAWLSGFFFSCVIQFFKEVYLSNHSDFDSSVSPLQNPNWRGLSS